ncbi:MAG: hypothetical protein R3F43_04645 [bacterium]
MTGGQPPDARAPEALDAGPSEVDAARPASPDAGPPDAGPLDAGLPDAGPLDAEPLDATTLDAGWAAPPELGPQVLDVPFELMCSPEATSALVQARGRPGGLYAIVEVDGPSGGTSPSRRRPLANQPGTPRSRWPRSRGPTTSPSRRAGTLLRVVSAGPEAGPVDRRPS